MSFRELLFIIAGTLVLMLTSCRGGAWKEGPFYRKDNIRSVRFMGN